MYSLKILPQFYFYIVVLHACVLLQNMAGSKHPVFCGISINLEEHKKKIYLMVVFIYLPLRDKNLFSQTDIHNWISHSNLCWSIYIWDCFVDENQLYPSLIYLSVIHISLASVIINKSIFTQGSKEIRQWPINLVLPI